MSMSLPPSLRTEVEKPHGSAPFIWLLEIEAFPATAHDPAQVMRFTTYHREIAWPVGHPLGITWSPFPFEVGNIELSGEGDLPHVDINIGNTTRFAMQYLHAAGGFEGRPVKLYLLTEAGLSLAYPDQESIAWRFTVAGSVANTESVTLRLAAANFFHVKTPPDRYVPARCRWPFGGNECGYVVNAVSAFTTCNKTFSDCVARGNDEAALLRPVLHPRRFGGFPGIPQQRT